MSFHSISRSSSASDMTANGMSQPTEECIPVELQAEILATIDETLSHIRYAVCGTAALTLWGKKETGPCPALSIVCCNSAMGVIESWAACKGWTLYAERPDVIGIPAGHDGKVYPFKVHWMDEDMFSQLHIVTFANDHGSHIRVLRLDNLLDMAACNYVYDAAAVEDAAVRDAYAQEILWILWQFVDAGDASSSLGSLTRQNTPAILDPLFYMVFPMACPEAEQLFINAGLELPKEVYEYDEQDTLEAGPEVPSKDGMSSWQLVKPLPPCPLEPTKRWQDCFRIGRIRISVLSEAPAKTKRQSSTGKWNGKKN